MMFCIKKMCKDLSWDNLFTDQLPYVQMDQALQGGQGHRGNHLDPESEKVGHLLLSDCSVQPLIKCICSQNLE